MKYILILICTMAVNVSFGRTKIVDSIYLIKVNYSMQLNFNGYETYKASLYIKNNGSVFVYKNSALEESLLKNKEENQFSFNIIDTSEYRIKSDKEKVVEYVGGLNKEELFKVIEPRQDVNWHISEDTLKIGSYNCTKAIGKFRGRTYTVWFTTEIPTNFGPLKLHGLPGLILKLTDDTKEVIINVTAIQTNKTDLSLINEAKYKSISRTKYKEYLEKGLQDISKNISSKVGRGLKVEVKTSSLKTIEID